MPTVDFLAFATGGGANVEDQADYLADPTTGTGFESGIAESIKVNKVWRQSSFIAAGLATFVSNTLNIDVLDDGNLTNFVSELTSAIASAASGITPKAAVITANTTHNCNAATEYALGFALSVPTAFQVNLDAATAVGGGFIIEDLGTDFSANHCTVTPPGGATISGFATFVMNAKNQSAEFRKYSATQWSVRS